MMLSLNEMFVALIDIYKFTNTTGTLKWRDSEFGFRI